MSVILIVEFLVSLYWHNLVNLIWKLQHQYETLAWFPI